MACLFMSAMASTRRVPPSHKPWAAVATNGQLHAADFLGNANSALLVADRGAGKTAITFRAYLDVMAREGHRRMLVVAPLRVCQLVWRQEAKEWTEFRHLRFSFLHGDKKDERLKDDADIWLINPEGVKWLCDKSFGRGLPFDIVCFDQLIRFKDSQGKRFKALRKRLKGVKRRWGLEGAIAPNGYEDLFGQMLMLDDGAALGPYKSHYLLQYFQPAFDGFNYTLQPGGAGRIEKRIEPYVFRLPYTEKPPLHDEIIEVQLDPKERKLYERLKKDMLVELGAHTITAVNSAVVYGKLKQLASGAVYTGNEREWVHVHDKKLDALEELIDELNGAPLLIAYEFRHDLERLLKRFPKMRTFDGLNERQAQELQDAWNANEVPYMAAHPASIGHGLNLQKGGACHIAHFTLTIDYNYYEELIGRLERRGNSASKITNHIFIVKDTIDETLTLPAIRDKSYTQNTLLARLAETCGVPAAGVAAADQRSTPMSEVQRLSRQGNGAAPPATRPSTWGKPKDAPAPAQEPAQDEATRRSFGTRTAAAVEQIGQREAITRRISQQPEDRGEQEPEQAPVDGKVGFSRTVQKQLEAPPGEADRMAKEVDNVHDAKPTRTRRPKEVETTPALTGPSDAEVRAAAMGVAVELVKIRQDVAFEPGLITNVAQEIYDFLKA